MFFSYLFDGLDRPVFLFENGMVWHMIVPYTPEGPPSMHLLSNGGIRSFGYDGLQRLSAHAYTFAASPGVAWTFARNAAARSPASGATTTLMPGPAPTMSTGPTRPTGSTNMKRRAGRRWL